MFRTNPRRRVALVLAAIAVILIAAPTSSQAFKWGKKNERALVERPNSSKDAVPTAEPANRPPASAPKPSSAPAPKPATQPSSTPEPAPAPAPKKSFFAKKTELEKRQEELKSAKKDYDRKKYKKSLEKSSQLIADIRERGYLKGPEAVQFRALMNEALELAQKSGDRYDEPPVPSGFSGKTLVFVF